MTFKKKTFPMIVRMWDQLVKVAFILNFADEKFKNCHIEQK